MTIDRWGRPVVARLDEPVEAVLSIMSPRGAAASCDRDDALSERWLPMTLHGCDPWHHQAVVGRGVARSNGSLAKHAPSEKRGCDAGEVGVAETHVLEPGGAKPLGERGLRVAAEMSEASSSVPKIWLSAGVNSSTLPPGLSVPCAARRKPTS